MITITAFRWVPPFARGVVRDLRPRWALEEAGLDYQVRLVAAADLKTPDYRTLQPFGQVPAYDEDGLVLFESGAMVLHVAERSPVLMPADPAGRARVSCWTFAALNSIEPALQGLAELDLFHEGEDWVAQARPAALEFAQKRLTLLSEWLNGRDYLEDRFTAADLMMTTVLRILRHTDLVQRTPGLGAYVERCEARPAFQRALAGQLGDFLETRPAS